MSSNKLINTLCENHPNLEGCCAAGIISGMWREKLPLEVARSVANMSLQGKEKMKDTLRTADSVMATLQQRGAVAAVSAVSAAAALDLDDSADAPALQIAAASGRGRFAPRGNRTGGQAGGQRAQPREGPHPDGPPKGACNTHYKYG